MKKLNFFLMLLVLSSAGFLAFFKTSPVQAADHKLWTKPGPQTGQVTLYWTNVDDANNYHIVYGTEKGKAKFGTTNIGWVTSYTVGRLNPGTTYYFAIVPVKNDVALYTSEWTWAKAPGTPGEMMAAAPAIGNPQMQAPMQSQMTWTGKAAGKQWLRASTGSNAGEVTLTWRNVDSAEDYHLVYGTMPGKYTYGSLNIGLTNKFTVRFLRPGVNYYFALIPLVANQPLYTTGPVSAWAKSNMEVVQTTRDAVMQPKPVTKQTMIPVPSTEVQNPPVTTVSPEVTQAPDNSQPTTPAGY